jgi:hypothetical protein
MFSMVFTPAENIPLFELLVGQRRKGAIVLGQLRLGGGRMTQQCGAIVDKPFIWARPLIVGAAAAAGYAGFCTVSKGWCIQWPSAARQA